VILEDALEHRAQVGGGFEIAFLEQIALLKAGPIRDDAAALQRPAGEPGDPPGAVVGTFVAVDMGGAAEN
jgi:hypothetical protein